MGTLVAAELARACLEFLESLDDEQRRMASFGFQGDDRTSWAYTPTPREGLSLGQMEDSQRKLAFALLGAPLSETGRKTARSIIEHELVLRQVEESEGIDGSRRDPSLYFFSAFDEPGDEPWGLRIEGHHLSLNYSVVRESVSVCPSFFGANPAEVPIGDKKGLRILEGIEEVARALVTSLSPQQRVTAVVDEEAPADILTTNDAVVHRQLQPSGVTVKELDGLQQQMVAALIREYSGRYRGEVLSRLRGLFEDDDLHFCWAGSLRPGEPHYYRLQGTRLLIEYDNTQNEANHIHSVIRDLSDDFGRDLLREHLARDRTPVKLGHTRKEDM